MDRIKDVVLAMVRHDLKAETRLPFWHGGKLDKIGEHSHRGQTAADKARERFSAHLHTNDGRRIAVNFKATAL